MRQAQRTGVYWNPRFVPVGRKPENEPEHRLLAEDRELGGTADRAEIAYQQIHRINLIILERKGGGGRLASTKTIR
jgi:hypothetical protein